jgi:hypothetical protein
LNIAQSKGYTRFGASLPEKKQSHLPKCHAPLKNQMDKARKKQVVSVNFSHTLFSLFDMATLEGGTDWLSHNIDKELPLYTA